jgi:polar amino acid transport system substrate-binding protein
MLSEGAVLGFAADPPWGIINPDGSLGGAMPEMDMAILAEMGVPKTDGEAMEFGAMIPSLLSGRTDMNTSLLNITPERCEAVIYATPSSCSVETLVVSTERAGDVTSYADIAAKGLRLAIIPGGEPMTGAANAAGVPEENRVAFTDYVDAIKLLQTGRVDAIPAAEGSATDMLKRYGDDGSIAIVPLYDLIACSAASFRKEDTALRDAYNAAFDRLLAAGKIEEIMAKYDLAHTLKDIDKANLDTLCSAK